MATCMRPISIVFLLVFARSAAAQHSYFPPRHGWQTRTPAQSGFNEVQLDAAIAYAKTMVDTLRTDSAGIANARPSEAPHNATIGPWLTPRGPEGGLIVRNGYIVAQWGDARKPDMTFSVTKSFLSTIAGLAFDAGLIESVTDTVSHDVPIPEFTKDPHNARITWHQLLNQTSEWQGTLWDKPDWADRYNPQTGKRPVLEPGTKWTYNDVRVNVLSLALLNLWRRPLPQVLREMVMDPIGASGTWRWWGYNNSWIDLDGLRVQSVSGGGHWGGGMHINTEDMARYGLLFLRNGEWAGKQLLSERWIAMATAPTAAKEDYGYLWWLGPGGAFSARGAGGNYIYVNRALDLVVVLRWTRDFKGVITRIENSMSR